MNDDGLTQLARRHGLGDPAARQLRRLLELLASDPSAPTAVTRPEDARDVHLADSLAGLEIDAIRAAGVIADLGSGAGFPGLPLAVALPHARVHLVESAQRKCRFLERAVAAAGARNAEVVAARAEEWPAGRSACDVVTARALAPLAVLVEYAAPLLRAGGVLVAWKGRRDRAEEADGATAAAVVGLEARHVRRVRPYAAARDRHLHVYAKAAPTPGRFPRRAGMARKRPLGARPRRRALAG